MKTIRMQINGQETDVPEGKTILQASQKLGIFIPTLCYLDSLPAFTSCMICVVEDQNSGKLIPACSTPVQERMRILTESNIVIQTRQAALEFLLSDHIGNCQAPCQRACPAHLDIPEMMTAIKNNCYQHALEIIWQHIPFPSIIGRICPAPCEKACRRNQADQAIAICKLKQLVSDQNLLSDQTKLPEPRPSSDKKVAIVGAGPAGLSSAFYLTQMGHQCTLFDENEKPGGSMRYQLTEKQLPRHILDQELGVLESMGATLSMNQKLGNHLNLKILKKNFDAVILAIGTTDKKFLDKLGLRFTELGIHVEKNRFRTCQPNIFAVGSVVKKKPLAVKSMADGRLLAFDVDTSLRDDKTDVSEKRLKLPVTSNRESSSARQNNDHTHSLSSRKTTGNRLADRFNSRCYPLTEDEKDFCEFHNTRPKSDGDWSKQDMMQEASACILCRCEKSDNCKLRDLADIYKVQVRSSKENLQNKRRQNDHPLVIYDPGKCIKCGICIRYCETQKEDLGLTFIGRGFDVQVGVPLNHSLEKGLKKVAHQCALNCPTGALILRQNGFSEEHLIKAKLEREAIHEK